jgi:hypothetical protein
VSAKFSGLLIFNDTEPYILIPDSVKEWLTDMPTLYQGITELVNLISTYESYSPPHGPPQVSSFVNP